MSNNFFQFKQFTIHQDKCAMRVCTDSCLFGAMISSNITQPSNILDIGAGTGLLSLMIAQKTTAHIDAIEIDADAYQQAKENFEASPWKKRLNIFNVDALQFQSNKKYDCIISNPPFFDNDLRSGNQQKNAAKHDSTLTLEQLLNIVNDNLSAKGVFAVLLPYHRTDYFITTAKEFDFRLQEKTLVKQTPSHDFFRSILFFSRKEKEVVNIELSIKNAENQYTKEFSELLKDYYLYL